MNYEQTLKFFGGVNKSVYGVNPYKIESIDGLSGLEEQLALKALNNEETMEAMMDDDGINPASQWQEPYREEAYEPNLPL